MKEENALHCTNPEFLTIPAQTTRARELPLANAGPQHAGRASSASRPEQGPAGPLRADTPTAWGRTDRYYELLF